ncbi:MAG: RNA recognition motif domain-containing protein [Candidatus Shapirobacteria bacterium]|nr:RNA recognition motif domain-containing protein [Candidatus Shapirobacteria bacterium]
MNENKPVSKRLFIGSLPYRFTEGELLDLFISEGKIISVRIMHNRWGKSRGLGYIEYENLDDAIRAKEKYHNFNLGDRSIIVDYAQPDPFLTPEGKARHEEALAKHPNRRQALNYLPHPDSDTNEYQKRSFQAHSPSRFSFNDNQNNHNSEFRPHKKYKGGKPVFNSLGKSLNRDTSGEFVPKFIPEPDSRPKKKFRPRPGQKPEYLASSPLHVRSSVFKQRHFGSRTGAKFAAKSKNK